MIGVYKYILLVLINWSIHLYFIFIDEYNLIPSDSKLSSLIHNSNNIVIESHTQLHHQGIDRVLNHWMTSIYLLALKHWIWLNCESLLLWTSI